MTTRKSKNFSDPDLDFQITEIVTAINAMAKADPVTVNAPATDLTTAVELVNQLRAALIAKGICS